MHERNKVFLFMYLSLLDWMPCSERKQGQKRETERQVIDGHPDFAYSDAYFLKFSAWGGARLSLANGKQSSSLTISN